MASYTMPLRAYIESFTQYVDDLTFDEKLEEGRKHLFDFDYPFFDEDYRKAFELKFIRNFYMREIGFETEQLFKLRLRNWLDLNMPYWNQMFESERIEFDPLDNTRTETTENRDEKKNQKDKRKTNQDVNTTGTSSGESTGNTESNQDSFNRAIKSDTPDSRLNLTANDGEGLLEYASEIDETTGKSNVESTDTSNTQTDTQSDSKANIDDDFESDINTLEEYVRLRSGKIGVQSYSTLLKEYRETFLRIEKQIFDEMNVLFMGVY